MLLGLWSCGRRDAVHQIHSPILKNGSSTHERQKTRLGWIRLYEQLGDAGLVCRRCGISRPILRKWWRLYQAEGIVGLEERSRRPRRPAGRKIFAEQEALILELRRSRQLGIKQLRNELLRDHGLRLSLDTLHRVLAKHGERRLKRSRLVRKGTKR
jgi:transposase-like protein